MIVSIYKNVIDTEGAKADLFDILTTDRWRHLSDKVRAEAEKNKRDKLKQQLPAFTPSGIFKDCERTEKGLIKHSGYMCIDIDGDDNPRIGDWQAVVFELGKLPQVAFAGLSVSGNGVFSIIPIKYSEKHKEHFKAFQKSFERRGLIIDPKCGNLSRLRFYSHNEHYYINREAEPYLHLYKDADAPKPIYAPMPYSPTMHSDASDAEALVREIETSNINIVPDYDTWFKVAASLSNIANGCELFHRISQVDGSMYNYKECNKMYHHIKPGKGVTIGTLFYIAKNEGITVQKRENSNTYYDQTKPKRKEKNKLFAGWSKTSEITQQTSHSPQQNIVDPTPVDEQLVCFVDKGGVLYIPTQLSDGTYTVYDNVEQYNARKGLPSIMDKDQVDISQMDKQYLNVINFTVIYRNI